MTWYRVYKTFRNGQSKISYFEVPKYSKKDIVEDYARDWAERTSGGHNYGWTVYWSRVKKPSRKWLIYKIESLKQDIPYYKERIKYTKKRIIEIKSYL